MMFLKIKWLLVVSLLLISANAIADIETVKDLRILKAQSETSNLPILLMFTAEDCEYCDALRENYLLPMIKSGDYESLTLIKQIYIDEYSYIRNGKGELVGGDSFAVHYDVDVTPTILFLNSSGKELTQRLVGIGNIYFFGDTLDKHIAQAKAAYDKMN